MDDERIGHLMRRWRRAAGLSQDDAGSCAGMSQSAWSRVESGVRTLRWIEGLRFASALGVDPEALTEDPMKLIGEAFPMKYGALTRQRLAAFDQGDDL